MIRAFLVAAALAGSLAVNAGLFSFLPLMGYWNAHKGAGLKGKTAELHALAMPVMPKKKEKPKEKESRKTPRKKTVEPGKSVARQRFVMDLGPGGGSGAGVSGAGVSGGDLQQVSYAEGETDEDAKVISQTAPKKPKKAEAAGAGGLVRCLLTIGEDGRVADVQFLEVPGAYGFEEAVREALKEWRFKPAMNSGMAVRQKLEQPFRF
ncbi:MAG TPA: energy transducer TonB [Fibrobacteria bacterium]|nr:energy transducer TonB [Fibrobacteria bacterium]